MCPVNGRDKFWANLDSLEELRTRGFTESQIQVLFDAYQDNWLTEHDLDIMAAAGCNKEHKRVLAQLNERRHAAQAREGK